jgi:hypothetical protein
MKSEIDWLDKVQKNFSEQEFYKQEMAIYGRAPEITIQPLSSMTAMGMFADGMTVPNPSTVGCSCIDCQRLRSNMLPSISYTTSNISWIEINGQIEARSVDGLPGVIHFQDGRSWTTSSQFMTSVIFLL